MRSPAPRGLVPAALAAVLTIGAWLVFAASEPGPRPVPMSYKTAEEIVVWQLLMLTAVAVGAVVSVREPANRIWTYFAWGGAAGSVSLLADQWVAFAARGRAPGAGPALAVSYLGLYVCWALLAVFVPLVFPTGTLRSRRWRVVAWTGALGPVLCTFEVFRPGAFGGVVPEGRNPLAVESAEPVLASLSTAGLVALFAAMLLAIVSLLVRLFTSKGTERQQLKVVAYSVVVVTVLLFASALLRGPLAGTPFIPISDWIGRLLPPVLPASLGVAILRYGLYGIDVVINRTLVYGAMASFVTGVYVALVVGVGSAARTRGGGDLVLSIAATATAAIAFQPVRTRVERLANRLVYGERASPYEVIAGFSRRVAGVLSLDDVLPDMARAASRGVAATSARVTVLLRDGSRRSASWPPGSAASGVEVIVPIRQRDEQVGEIGVVKPADDPLRDHERQLLEDLALQAGIAVRNVQLAEELRVSLGRISDQADELRRASQRIIEAQDAERRRVERDLHDGAQQRLVGLALTLRTAMKRIESSDHDGAGDLLVRAAEDVKRAHLELRDLARGIYPAVLSDRGLRAALEHLALQSPVPVDLDVEDMRHPPAVEATAYFVVSECLANVAKYAAAGTAVVRVCGAGDVVCVEVADDGRGGADVAAGSGLRGLADRAAALGGSLHVDSPAGGGTRVTARLPCA